MFPTNFQSTEARDRNQPIETTAPTWINIQAIFHQKIDLVFFITNININFNLER